MDENSDPHGVKKRGERFGGCFCFLKKIVKIQGRKKEVLSEYHQTPINK